jgi:hypothetical protein
MVVVLDFFVNEKNKERVKEILAFEKKYLKMICFALLTEYNF